MIRSVALLALLLATGCRAGGAVANAAVNTALAAAVAGERRAQGECFTPCLPGTRCDPVTGYCDPLPCRGQCQSWERCEESGLLPRCLPAADAQLQVSDQAPPTGR